MVVLYAHTGTVEDGHIQYVIEWEYHFWDPYDWNPNDPNWNPLDIFDWTYFPSSLAGLHLRGLAQQYMTTGSYSNVLQLRQGGSATLPD